MPVRRCFQAYAVSQVTSLPRSHRSLRDYNFITTYQEVARQVLRNYSPLHQRKPSPHARDDCYECSDPCTLRCELYRHNHIADNIAYTVIPLSSMANSSQTLADEYLLLLDAWFYSQPFRSPTIRKVTAESMLRGLFMFSQWLMILTTNSLSTGWTLSSKP